MGVSFQIQYISSQTQSFPYPPTIITVFCPLQVPPGSPSSLTRFNDTNSTPKHLGEILK